MKDMLFALLAAVFAIVAIYFFYAFQSSEDAETSHLVIGAISIILAVIFGVLFMSKRVNKTEDIHITE